MEAIKQLIRLVMSDQSFADHIAWMLSTSRVASFTLRRWKDPLRAFKGSVINLAQNLINFVFKLSYSTSVSDSVSLASRCMKMKSNLVVYIRRPLIMITNFCWPEKAFFLQTKASLRDFQFSIPQ